MKKAILIVAAALGWGGCSLNLMNSEPSQVLNRAHTTPTPSGSLPDPWYLFYESLSVGDWLGGLGLYVGGTAAYADFAVDFNNAEMPRTGFRNIKITYSKPIPASSWAGGTFTHTPNFDAFAATPGRNISAGGFTKCVFYAASPESRRAAFNAQGVNLGYVQLTPAFQRFQITLPGSQTAVKEFFGFAFDQANTVGPVTVYIDDLRYEK